MSEENVITEDLSYEKTSSYENKLTVQHKSAGLSGAGFSYSKSQLNSNIKLTQQTTLELHHVGPTTLRQDTAFHSVIHSTIGEKSKIQDDNLKAVGGQTFASKALE